MLLKCGNIEATVEDQGFIHRDPSYAYRGLSWTSKPLRASELGLSIIEPQVWLFLY